MAFRGRAVEWMREWGVMDDTRFFANFRWRSREPTTRKRFITLNGRRRADARRHAGTARHVGRQRRYFA
ncbi:hypothetical protein WJ99_26295 [Burkholderia ubonensis]|nr:hypothetical protein WJ99_26295 [Burkholderia ubonensis]KVU90746.1 hypothetical protein WK76_17265 [Burkholderia ubonensis]